MTIVALASWAAIVGLVTLLAWLVECACEAWSSRYLPDQLARHGEAEGLGGVDQGAGVHGKGIAR